MAGLQRRVEDAAVTFRVDLPAGAPDLKASVAFKADRSVFPAVDRFRLQQVPLARFWSLVRRNRDPQRRVAGKAAFYQASVQLLSGQGGSMSAGEAGTVRPDFRVPR